MHRSSIQNVFDQMFNRFHARTDNSTNTRHETESEDEKCCSPPRDVENKEHHVEMQAENAIENTDDVEVINVCDSDEDRQKDEDNDVVFLGSTGIQTENEQKDPKRYDILY